MARKIDQSLFPETQKRQDNQEHCPECGSALLIRHSKRGPFKACSSYPACDFSKAMTNNDGHVVKELGLPCPECGDELVLRQGRYGMFIGCSAYPVCQHIEKRESQPQEAKSAIACPECGTGTLTERKSRYGKTFYACDAYPKCKFAVNQTPVQGACEACGFGLLVEKKSANGNYKQCASRKCQHRQTEVEPEV
ncbi:topoisomerase DNA-binding C4 zinc finger domain-containing protein [Veronia pacifica]|uniref:DNA topoisomerase n=1 Tax=Veronia pacifica TaxID=1080227 RepID=A0A1C3EFG7_9GAMM|nr:topoisomerase DNA-binding C4 zinc finger domain-containing protein [Veronia pacifica]ODA31985.1 DNA topoisomerase [Veronia pacifica]